MDVATDTGEQGFQGGRVLAKSKNDKLLAFKANKVQAVQKDVQQSDFTDEAVFRTSASTRKLE